MSAAEIDDAKLSTAVAIGQETQRLEAAVEAAQAAADAAEGVREAAAADVLAAKEALVEILGLIIDPKEATDSQFDVAVEEATEELKLILEEGADVLLASNDLTTFLDLVEVYNGLAVENPRLDALTAEETAVEDAVGAIEALAEALQALVDARANVAQLEALNDAIAAAEAVFEDNGFDVPVTLNAGANLATADSDIFLIGEANSVSSITNFGLLGDDLLFIGTGYTLVLLGDKAITERVGSASTLEVFVKNDVGGNATLYVELDALAGSGTNTDDITTITLTGVSVDNLVFENGVFSLA